MGKSRFEGMEIAIREQSKIAESGVNDKIKIDKLKLDMETIDNETQQKIEEIKNTPINKELLKKQAENDLQTAFSNNKRDHDNILQQAKYNISQDELNADNAYKQAQIEISNKREKLALLESSVAEQKAQRDLAAQQEYEVAMASIDNTEKTIALRIQKAEQEASKRKKEIELNLRTLEAKDKIVEEQKRGWDQFYRDVVEISKQQPTS